MPADIMEKNSSSPVAATPASVNTTPDKPKTASEHRKSSRHSKLEKADILEMTVKHLRNLQRAQMTAALSTDPSVLGKYRAGFSECMNEVTRFLSTCEGVNTEVRTRLLGHLANCMTQINAMTYPGQAHPALQAPPPPPPSGPAGPQHAPFAPPPPPLVPIPGGAAPPPGSAPCKLGSQAGEAAKVFGGFQVVPAPDGQFAFLIPNGAFAHSGPVIPVYTSNSGTSVGPNAVSPSSGSSLTSDSMWRPWRN
ncbi:transcription factor HES-1 isoform 2 [Mus musculus]|uniref:transcription factor HES-1 isoform 2 n=1 Tax=Mus musculus TaxID=10090 RepID=UPI0023587E81|nr:transcription factor HES-1 isoform 2 [Mus musculus]